ncbi:MAG: peptidoglycan DD-metalloendopeptidase family protein [Polyangiales bacterium]
MLLTATSSHADLIDKIDQIEAQLAENENVVVTNRNRLSQIDAEIEVLSQNKGDTSGRLIERARMLYRLRRSGMLPLAGGFDAMMRHLGRIQRLKEMVKSDLESGTKIASRKLALNEERKSVSESIAKLEMSSNELTEALRQVEQEQRRADDYAAMMAQRQRDDAERSDELAYGRMQVHGDISEAVRFSRYEGRLPFPLHGAREIRNAAREEGQGVEFVAPAGSEVRCVADGRVVFAKPMGSLGMSLVVDHGDSYYTVYGGLSSVVVRQGDWVSANARLGAVASVSNPKLYFEVRRAKQSLDAREWLGL